MADALTTPIRKLAVDITTCDREPIHIPGSIQPHGALLVLEEPSYRVVQASANTEPYLGVPVDRVLGRTLDQLVAPAGWEELSGCFGSRSLERRPLFLCAVDAAASGRRLQAIAHRINGTLVVELEPTEQDRAVGFRDLYPILRSFLGRLQSASSVDAVSSLAAQEVRRLTGFGRVLVYQFDPKWHGHVIAEDRDDDYAPYLDLWFPASDIPQPARDLYRVNRIRLIADAGSTPVPLVPALNPLDGRPTDLSFAALRAVSPVHAEYLRNMGVAASMSISIVREGRLWGLIACHDRTARTVPFEVRTACDLLGQVLALQLGATEHAAGYARRLEMKSIQARLLASMAARENFVDGLTDSASDLLALASAHGAAVVFGGDCRLVGRTPSVDLVRRLVAWLVAEGREDVFHTEHLPEEVPDGDAFRRDASGLLAIPISKVHESYVLWFRPEVVQTVKWGGDPRKPAEPGGADRLHPRKSFDTWRETVRGCSLPWRSEEIDAARDLRNDVVGVVLRKAEELAELSEELTRSNRELEAFSYSVSHDLRAPFRHIVGYSELLRERINETADPTASRYLETIIESAHFAGTLVDNLLSFSQIGRAALHPVDVDLATVVNDVRRRLLVSEAGRRIAWEVRNLPRVHADPIMLRLALENLLGNALKYTRTRQDARIEVWAEPKEAETVVCIRDNGVGFDMRYADKLFGVFQRLHRMEEFEGTGIGLANVRRIIARHGGRTWAEGEVDRGATFYFSLPSRQRGSEVD